MTAPQTEDLIAQLEALIDKVKPTQWGTEPVTTSVTLAFLRALLDALRTATDRAEALERERDEARERTSMAVTVGGGLAVYGSVEAIGRVQNYILIDSKHPIEKEDVRRSLMRDLQAAERANERLREALEAVSPAPGEPVEATKRRLYAERSILRDELMKGIGKIRVKNTAHVTALRPTLGESLSWSLVRDIADAAIDIQAAASPPTSPGEPPKGWKLVPEEPTPEMVAAFWRQKNTGCQEPGNGGPDRDDYSAYRAMLAVSPSPGSAE